MSKQADHVLLVPGESGWEIWSGAPSSGYALQTSTDILRASELTGLPSGDLTLLFPVRAVTALPLRVPSEAGDDSLFTDLAAMHAERLGLRPDPMAGQLSDTFVVDRDGESSTLLSVVLRSPVDVDLPPRSPKEFDLSARAIPYAGDSLVLWRELGRWVFAFSLKGKLLYCQTTSIEETDPTEALLREVKLALVQLGLQGISCHPSRVAVYASGDPSLSALVGSLGAPVELHPRPAPVVPEIRSKLLPADVRAARREAQKKQQIVAVASIIGLAYLGLAGWFGYGVWKDAGLAKKMKEEAESKAPAAKAYQEHVAKWDELGPVVDLSQSPVELLYRVSRSLPRGSGLRLKTAELSSKEVKLIGEAPQAGPANQFSLALKKNDQLAQFHWEAPAPNQTSKGWDFIFTGSTAQNP